MNKKEEEEESIYLAKVTESSLIVVSTV